MRNSGAFLPPNFLVTCDLLLQERCSDTQARTLTLEVVGAYVDWIELELVANDRFVPLLIRSLSDSETSEVVFGVYYIICILYLCFLLSECGSCR